MGKKTFKIIVAFFISSLFVIHANANSTFEQKIENFRLFIEGNNFENPFIVPYGLTFNEALNDVYGNADVALLAPMSYHQAPENTIWGSVIFVLNFEPIGDGTYKYETYYVFFDFGLFVKFDESVLLDYYDASTALNGDVAHAVEKNLEGYDSYGFPTTLYEGFILSFESNQPSLLLGSVILIGAMTSTSIGTNLIIKKIKG